MKEFDAKLFGIGPRYGLIMGGAFSAYTLLMWLMSASGRFSEV